MRTELKPALPFRQPRRVMGSQWGLAIFAMAVALIGYSAKTYTELALIACALTGINTVLVWSLFEVALQEKVLGKFLLSFSTTVVFYVEALSSALDVPSFRVLPGMPFPSLRFGQDLIKRAFFYIALFQIALFVGYSISPRLPGLLAWTTSRVDVVKHSLWIRCALALCIILAPLYYADFRFQEVFEALAGAYRRFILPTPRTGLLSHTTSLGLFGGSLMLSEAILFCRTRHRFLSLFLGLFVTAAVLLTGTRHLLSFVVFPVIAIALIRMHGTLKSRRILLWCTGAIMILLGIQVQLAIRTKGWDKISQLRLTELVPHKPGGQFEALLFAEYLVPQQHDYFLDLAEPYFIIYWIPRTVWPDKPSVPSWQFYNDTYTRNDPVWNVTPSIIGQYHMGWGTFGVVFIGTWLGLLTYVADRVLLALNTDRQHAMATLIGMAYVFVVSSFRTYHPFYFAYMVFAFIGMLLLTRTASSFQHAALRQPISEQTLSSKSRLRRAGAS